MSLSQIISDVIVAVTGALIVKYEKKIRYILHLKPDEIKHVLISGVISLLIGINAGFSINMFEANQNKNQQLKNYDRLITENLMLKKDINLFTQKFIYEEKLPDSIDVMFRTVSEQCLKNGNNPRNNKDRAIAYQQLILRNSIKEITAQLSLNVK